MGILDSFLGQQNIQIETSIVPANAASLITSGKLPVFNTNTILLTKNETCHFIDKVILQTEEMVNNMFAGSGSINYRLSKRMSARLGGMKMGPSKVKRPKYVNGVIYITNKRIIFTGPDESFEKKIGTLTSIIPQNCALGLQFNSKVYNIIMQRPDLLGNVIQLINDKNNK